MKDKYLKIGILLALSAALLISTYFFTKVDTAYCNDDGRYQIMDIFGLKLLSYNSSGSFLGAGIISLSTDKNISISPFKTRDKCYAISMHPNRLNFYHQGESVSEFSIDEGRNILYSFISDYNNDGNDEIFLLLKSIGEEYGDQLLIISYGGNSVNVIYNESFKKVNPWKVQVCDVDGDGQKEISLGVYTVAKYHPIFAKRPFIYYFHDNRLYPKWLGSRLSQPFDDYVFCDIDGDKMDELISIELTREGVKELNSYKWKGFGFESIGVSKTYDDIYDLEATDGGLTVRYIDNSVKGQKAFKYNNGKLE